MSWMARSWRQRICRSHSGPRTEPPIGSSPPGIRRSRRTYQNSVSGDLISFLLQARRKPRHSHPCPRSVPAGFFCCQIQMAQFLPDQPRMADSRASCSWALQTILHTASVRRPAGMELRMRPASRCWGDRKERLSRRYPPWPTPATSAPQGAHTLWRSGIRRPDKRAAQAVCGRKVAF